MSHVTHKWVTSHINGSRHTGSWDMIQTRDMIERQPRREYALKFVSNLSNKTHSTICLVECVLFDSICGILFVAFNLWHSTCHRWNLSQIPPLTGGMCVIQFPFICIWHMVWLRLVGSSHVERVLCVCACVWEIVTCGTRLVGSSHVQRVLWSSHVEHVMWSSHVQRVMSHRLHKTSRPWYNPQCCTGLHTATHRNTLQHTAIHCNTLPWYRVAKTHRMS